MQVCLINAYFELTILLRSANRWPFLNNDQNAFQMPMHETHEVNMYEWMQPDWMHDNRKFSHRILKWQIVVFVCLFCCTFFMIEWQMIERKRNGKVHTDWLHCVYTTMEAESMLKWIHRTFKSHDFFFLILYFIFLLKNNWELSQNLGKFDYANFYVLLLFRRELLVHEQ